MNRVIIPTKENLKITGRHVFVGNTLYLSFSASSVEFEFTGTYLSARIRTDLYDNALNVGYVGLFIDGVFERRIKLDKAVGEYELFKSDTPVKHVVKLMRFAETNFGKVGIEKLSFEGEIKPAKERKRKIEIIGDSISCGYGVEGKPTETFETGTENPAKAYSVLLAEKLEADLSLVSWSGNGIVSHYIPPEGPEEYEGNEPLMPEVYKYDDIAGYRFQGLTKPTEYDFTSFMPDTVVINLGTNDQSYTRGEAGKIAYFGREFKKFLSFVREKRPEAVIICALGVMGQDLCDEEQRVINELSETDKKISFFKLSVQDEANDGTGADWHPNEITQRKMADQIYAVIKENQNS